MTETLDYPQRWESDVLASDGGVVHLRPITPADADALVEFHSGLSERTRYLRYFGPYPTMSARDLERATHVDHRDRVALIALLGGRIIAVGIYERLPDSAGNRSAEVAFVVADAHQGRGLGSILLEHLAAMAAENGIEYFVAEVLAENRQMITVFREAGYQISRSRDGTVLHLEFAIDPTEALVSVRNSRERASEARSVRNLLAPGSVAVIGASRNPAKVGAVVLNNLLDAGFTGPVFPVHPTHRSIRGVRAYPTVREIPDDVDLAVIAVPASKIDSVLDDCMAKGVKGLVVLTAGFAESGPDGAAAERRLVASVRDHGMRLVGPNALGIVNLDPEVGLNASLAPILPGRGRIGFFCQSGPLGASILGQAALRGLGLSVFVSAGNRADLSGNDLLQYWDSDPETDVVLLYLESVGNPRKFSRISRRLARSKPIVAVRSGRGGVWLSAEPPPLQMSAPIMRDLFAQAGIIQVDSVVELFDCAALLEHQPLPAGRRIAVISNSAALAWLAIDAAGIEGLEVTEPVNLGPTATPADFEAAVRSAMALPTVDSIVVIFAPPVPVPLEPYGAALRAGALEGGKPVLSTFLAAEGLPQALATVDANGAAAWGSIPSYPDPGSGVRALGRIARYAAWRDRPVSKTVRPAGIDMDMARRLVAEWLAEAPTGEWLSDERVVTLLGCYGIDIVAFRPAESAEQAVAAAAELGYPVAVKATGPQWRSRPDLQGVRLDLSTPDGVREAYADLASVSDNPLVHVQRMATKGVGCVVRVADDPSFGSVMTFGLSGVMDLLGDRVYRALPLTEDEVAEMVEAPRAAPLLSGYRGEAPVDKSALRDLLRRISALAVDLPEVRELACEPVHVSPSGIEPLYARIRIGPEPSRPDTGPRRLR
ncbi:bifunctional GNAT family N-acetyltransferase/acetate--CoA ligase family protein [Skermania sp. ID1734]|uniref:bifunctional acetate--CoA ligase family protein/GNAT family N-acetyltransferase n=1 Tax=Skermania sp. ID1734 TaxID=2597516 RepID=UPI0021076FA6|nr:bifunctional GNAT family N-acetyltransferase/acetate--CoA ligase family protein [Skermania sp. ID1734]